MAIKIVLEDAVFCPQIECDHCKHRIMNTDKAMYGWYSGEWKNGTKSDVVFLHKGSCEYSYRMIHGKEDWCWEELGRFTQYLESNLEIPDGSPFAEIF